MFNHPKFENNGDYHSFQWELGPPWWWRILINWLLNVAETFIEISKHYVLQMGSVTYISIYCEELLRPKSS